MCKAGPTLKNLSTGYETLAPVYLSPSPQFLTSVSDFIRLLSLSPVLHQQTSWTGLVAQRLAADQTISLSANEGVQCGGSVRTCRHFWLNTNNDLSARDSKSVEKS